MARRSDPLRRCRPSCEGGERPVAGASANHRNRRAAYSSKSSAKSSAKAEEDEQQSSSLSDSQSSQSSESESEAEEEKDLSSTRTTNGMKGGGGNRTSKHAHRKYSLTKQAKAKPAKASTRGKTTTQGRSSCYGYNRGRIRIGNSDNLALLKFVEDHREKRLMQDSNDKLALSLCMVLDSICKVSVSAILLYVVCVLLPCACSYYVTPAAHTCYQLTFSFHVATTCSP